MTQRLIFCLLFIAQLGCAQKARVSAALPPAEFEQKLNAALPSATVLDVRTPEEFQGGHLEKAVNLDFYDDSFRERVARLDKTRPVFVYCAAGGRSGETAKMLKNLGFPAVYDLDGGMTAWQAAGKKTVQ
jgi:rhodanese-related sulfurtransferase